MRIRAFGPLGVGTLAVAAFSWAPANVAAQAQDPNQVIEAARKASPRTGDDALKYFEAEIAEKIKEATKRVYDPNKPAATNPRRTPWGDPDLSGYYVTATYTPLQRPKEVTKPLYTVEEAILAFRSATDADASVDPATVHYDWKEFGMEAWQSPVRPNMRTSLVVDPPDGRVPALTAEAQKLRAEAGALARQRDHQTGVEIFRNLYTRCITGNGAIPLVDGGGPGSDSAAGAGGVTTEVQLFQSPGFLTVLHQSNNDVRIIPISNSPHLPDKIRFWDGDSRGRWEGNTLVVESKNFKDKAPGANIQNSTDAITVVERFTVVDNDTLRYEYTLNDPKTWTRPWSVEAPLPRIDPPLYEFACHEQNYGLINLVMGAQIRATEGVFDPRDPRSGRPIQ
jgi:hypothetical protein